MSWRARWGGVSTESVCGSGQRPSSRRLRLIDARLPGIPLISMRITSSYDSRANRHSASTK